MHSLKTSGENLQKCTTLNPLLACSILQFLGNVNIKPLLWVAY